MSIFKVIAEIIFDLGVFINALLFVPQAIKVFRNRSSHGLSIITFGGFNILQLSAMIYGYFHHDQALIIGMALSLITCGAITLGILIFRKRGS